MQCFCVIDCVQEMGRIVNIGWHKTVTPLTFPSGLTMADNKNLLEMKKIYASAKHYI